MVYYKPLAVMAIGLLVLSTPFVAMALVDGDTEYEYTVKTEQVQSDSHSINDSQVTPYDELTDNEQQALYDAYKQSDHFLGGAEVHIVTDERLTVDTVGEWKVVEVQGVRLLTSIQFEDTRTTYPEIPDGATFLAILVGVMMILGGVFWHDEKKRVERRRNVYGRKGQ
jgi:hypothetical protein